MRAAGVEGRCASSLNARGGGRGAGGSPAFGVGLLLPKLGESEDIYAADDRADAGLYDAKRSGSARGGGVGLG
ncbi:hypothetical protein DN745_04815 [Bradymonas sediminis]|uniref:Uncharacterized protein n=1 Tax=Bradymonas sediminis TaxID=1548548 RepID=A0A2Z4FIW8_9DELT|nr:hypothetical protein DN745_04815 [Bradymonas sediminis]